MQAFSNKAWFKSQVIQSWIFYSLVALAELTSQMRGMPQLCPGGLYAVASGGACVSPEPNCLLGHDFCKTSMLIV